MREVKVIYTSSSTSTVRALMAKLSRHLRVEVCNQTQHTIVFLNKDLPWYHREGDKLFYNAFTILSNNGHEPFWAPVKVRPRTKAFVDSKTGELKFAYEQKHHFEHLDKTFQVVFGILNRHAEWDRVTVKGVYLMGPHSHVRKAKRKLCNMLSNGKVLLKPHDLETLRTVLSNKTDMYLLTENSTVINVSDLDVVGSEYDFYNDTVNTLDNTQVVWTGKHLKRLTCMHKWQAALILAKGV